MISRIFAHLKKATHVVVLLSYLFHGIAPAIATRASFEMGEVGQKRFTTLETLHEVMRKGHARREAIWNEKKHEAFSLTSQNKQAPVREEQRPYDGSHLGFRTQVKSFEEGYTLSVQSLSSKMNGSVWPGVQFTLTQKDGAAVRTLENRIFSSKTFNASTFDSMGFDEEEQQNVLPFKDWKNRSLGFSYDLKGVGRIYVCWEGSLLLHNLQFRDVALNIQTTGAILANNLEGSTLNLEGRAIAFGGDNNKISTLSMSFGDGLESENQGLEGQGSTDFGTRIAHVMPGAILVTRDFSVQGGILQNSGRLSALKSFEGIDTHVINDDHITAEALTLKGGTLKNQGTLKAPLTAEGIDLMDNSGVIEGSWSVSSTSFINTGSITGTGRLKADVLENYGLMGNGDSVFNIKKTVRNDGYLTSKRVTGHGTFTNHNTFETEVLDVPVFLNQQRENVPFKPSIAGDSLTITKRVRQFTNDKDATIAVKRLVMEKREGAERQVKNDGVIEGDQITLQGSVDNKGTINTKNFAWNGSTFKTEDFKADHLQLEGERLQNFGSFEALSGSLFLHHLENQGDINLMLTSPSEVTRLINKGGLTVQGTAKVVTLVNQKKSKLFLKDGTLQTNVLDNQGAVTLDGFVTVLNDGRLQFGDPALANTDTWQTPGRIQGTLGLGVHLSVSTLDRLKRIPEDTLHVYGKSFSNTSDRVFLHPLHLLVEAFKNTSRLRAPQLSVKAKTLENHGSITGSTLTLHATQKGQNPGRLEATERLDVDLPQIDSLGTMISKGDLIFKTRDRSITLRDNQSWLQVGRNLHMILLNGNLKLKAKLKFPGDVKVKADRFNLKGSLKAKGDLDVETSENIALEAVRQEIQPLELLIKNLEKRTNDQGAFQSFVKNLSPAEEECILFHLKQSKGLRVGAPQSLSLSQVLQWYSWGEVMGVLEWHLQRFLHYFGPRSFAHTTTLSTLTSKGHLSLKGQNVHNLGGQVQGDQSLTIEALQNIVNGSSYKTTQEKISFYCNKTGYPWLSPVQEIKGNGSFFSTFGELSLQAGLFISNIHGLMLGLQKIEGKSIGMTNAGHMLSGGDIHLLGKTFHNQRQTIIEIENAGDPHAQWDESGELVKSGRIMYPKKDSPASGPAILQALGDIILDFSQRITNIASHIMAGGTLHEKKASIIDLPIKLNHWTLNENVWSQQKRWSPFPGETDIILPVSSGGMGITIDTLQEVLNGGIMSSPTITITARSLSFAQKGASRNVYGASSAMAVIPTNIPLLPYMQRLSVLEHLQRQQDTSNSDSSCLVIVGSGPIPSERTWFPSLSFSLPIFGSTTQTLFALQQAFTENFHKSYILPYLKPLEQFIKFQNNARKIALKHRGQRALPWKPLVVSEEEAAKTTLPMILYRPTLVEDVERLVPEYWGPKDLIQRFLMSPCGGAVADTAFQSKTHDLTVNGNIYAGQSIQSVSDDITIEPQIVNHTTPHGSFETLEGANLETDAGGTTDMHAQRSFRTGNGTINVPGGKVSLTADCPMDFGTTITRSHHNNGETMRSETIHHPIAINTGDINIATKHPLSLAATQAKATRTIWAIGSSILAPSVVDTYHQQQTTKQRDLFGSTTTKETTHREAHQVLNFEAGISTNTIATSGSLDLTAPIMTAPRINFDFSDSGMLLRSFEDWFSYNREELDKNAFLITSSISGSSSKKVGEAQLNGHVTVPKGKPIHIESREDSYKNNGSLTQAFPGATFDPKSDESQSWEETKTSVGPGLSTLIAIGVSMIMPGIGTGVTGAMFTKGAETLGAQALVGMINNGGNILKTLEDMTSGDSLRSVATSMVTAGLTQKLSEITKIPVDSKGDDFVNQLESRMIHMASQIPVESVLSRKSFGEVFQDSLTSAASKLVGSYGAANIGSFCDSYQVAEFGQYLAHAAVGAAAAKVRDGDVAAGAIGAVVGRAVGSHLQEEMDKYGITEDHLDYERALDRAIDIARFTAASFACVLGQDAEDAACAADNAARYGTVSSSPFTPKTPSQEAYAAMRREGVSEEMAKAALNNPQFQRLLQEGLSFEADVQQSEAYHAQMLREDLEAQQSGGILRLTVGPNHITATDMALEYFQKAAVFTTEHPHLTAATFYGLQAAIGGPLNVLRGMVQDVLIGDQRDAIRQVLKTSIANHLGITDQSDTTDQLKFDIAFTSGEFGFSFLLGAGIKVVKDSAQNVAKAIRREERVLQSSTTSLNKRGTRTESEAIEPTRKSQRLANKTSPSGKADGAKTSGITQPGAEKSTIQQTQTSVKLRGTNNPKVRKAIAKGREEHAKLRGKIKEKSQKNPGWQSEERVINDITGEIVIPDGITPSRRPLELKPNTPSGRKQGARQLKRYEEATGKKGRVIYYDPNK